MTENVTYCDKHVSSQKCIFIVVLASTSMMNGHFTVSKALEISSFNMIVGVLRAWILCAVPWTIMKLSWMDRPQTKALWCMPIIYGKSSARRTDRAFSKILTAPCTRLIGRKSLVSAAPSTFDRVISALLINCKPVVGQPLLGYIDVFVL